MAAQQIILLIAGMTLVTYLPRLLPLLVIGNRPLPPLLKRWLEYLPLAILASLLGPMLLAGDSAPAGGGNVFFWASWPTAAVAWRSRNMPAAIITGMAAVALLRLYL